MKKIIIICQSDILFKITHLRERETEIIVSQIHEFKNDLQQDFKYIAITKILILI